MKFSVLPYSLRSRPIYPPNYCTPSLRWLTDLKFNNIKVIICCLLPKPASSFMTPTIINGTTIHSISPSQKLGIIIHSSLILFLQSLTSIDFTTEYLINFIQFLFFDSIDSYILKFIWLLQIHKVHNQEYATSLDIWSSTYSYWWALTLDFTSV